MSQYLMSFTAADTQYALDVRQAAEVIRIVAVNAVAGSPPWLHGLMNLRGRVLPVVDVRMLLTGDVHPINLTTPIIIASHGSTLIGLLVDRVDDISIVHSDTVSTLLRPFISGVIRDGSHLTFIIKLDEIVERTQREVGGV